MRYARFSICILWVLAASAKADQFCFALAATYYEQVYCQLQAKAQTKSLPPFNQFKKNSEPVQFSLLKRPAERNAIKLPAPTKKIAVIVPHHPEQAPADPISSDKTHINAGSKNISSVNANLTAASILSSPENSNCELHERTIRCGNKTYVLSGNRANHRLSAAALTADNKMALPSYMGGALNPYLTEAYRQYIVKMLEIGLGGVTMSYRKFAFLYQDLHSKGLDFSQRFETMYGFLKKDKAAMGVSEAIAAPQGLAMNHCSTLNERLYVCDLQGRNYIFAVQ